jgi:hypothetical protein
LLGFPEALFEFFKVFKYKEFLDVGQAASNIVDMVRFTGTVVGTTENLSNMF